MTTTKKLLLSLLASSALILSACSSGDSSTTETASSPTTPASTATAELDEATGIASVVATTTMLGDVAQDIVDCAGGTVEVLTPIGVDPHEFSASSAQIASLVNAAR